MSIIPIDKKTKWECQQCGDCCKDIILSKNKSLSIEVDGKPVCKFLNEDNMCNNYKDRPYICRIYPFVVDFDKMACEDGVARPQIAFALENLQIHTECPGYGKGKRVYANKNLQRKIDKIRYEFAVRFKEVVDKKGDAGDALW